MLFAKVIEGYSIYSLNKDLIGPKSYFDIWHTVYTGCDLIAESHNPEKMWAKVNDCKVQKAIKG